MFNAGITVSEALMLLLICHPSTFRSNKSITVVRYTHPSPVLTYVISGTLRIRKSLFWDVDFSKINWGKYKDAVLKRVFERGSKDEIEEISRYYNLSTK